MTGQAKTIALQRVSAVTLFELAARPGVPVAGGDEPVSVWDVEMDVVQ